MGPPISNKSNFAPFDENFPEGEWTALPALTGPEGEAYYGLYEGNFNLFAVSQSAADEGKKEAIARLLEWIADDGYYLLGFGEEGVNALVSSTRGWECSLFNDRTEPFYPRWVEVSSADQQYFDDSIDLHLQQSGRLRLA